LKYLFYCFKVVVFVLYFNQGKEGKMNKYELTTKKKKKAIINSAMSLFNNKGFTNTSIKEIAALANVSQVSIYNYFGSKEALMTECANIVMADTIQKARDILAMDIDFLEKIELALSLSTEHINLSISEYFTNEALSDTALVDVLFRNINENKRNIYREYIELGKQEKIISNSIPTNTLLDFIDAINLMGSKLEFNDDIVTAIKNTHHLLLYGIIGKP